MSGGLFIFLQKKNPFVLALKSVKSRTSGEIIFFPLGNILRTGFFKKTDIVFNCSTENRKVSKFHIYQNLLIQHQNMTVQ